MTAFAFPQSAAAQIVTVSDRADPPPFWVRRVARVLPLYAHVELAPERPRRRNLWAAALDAIALEAAQPMLLLAYGVSCHAVGWWARLSPLSYVDRVAAAVLVRPTPVAPSTARYAEPHVALPFPAVVVDDRADDARHAVRSRAYARASALPFLDLAHPDLPALTGSTPGAREQLVLALLDRIVRPLPEVDARPARFPQDQRGTAVQA